LALLLDRLVADHLRREFARVCIGYRSYRNATFPRTLADQHQLDFSSHRFREICQPARGQPPATRFVTGLMVPEHTRNLSCNTHTVNYGYAP
jgi:hypothetical protein